MLVCALHGWVIEILLGVAEIANAELLLCVGEYPTEAYEAASVHSPA
jgi:hypothetical protein